MEYGPVLPSWFVLPLGMLALLAVAAHMIVLREHALGKMPESRRQIRMITGWVMMFTIPLIAYGFGIVSPTNHEAFVLSWTCILLLLSAIMLLACVDAVNNLRIARSQHRKIREQFRAIMNPEQTG